MTAVCDNCEGTRECQRCAGTGIITNYDIQAFCTLCSGTGVCDVCGGTGKDEDISESLD